MGAKEVGAQGTEGAQQGTELDRQSRGHRELVGTRLLALLGPRSLGAWA